MENAYTSAKGVKIYGYKNPSSHGFFISLFLRAGSMYESEEENGITHFFEHIAIRNVNKIMSGNLYSELDRRGVEFNASTFSEMVQFYVSGSCKNFDFGAQIITRLLSSIVLKRDEIETEKRRIKAEIREADEKNSILTFTNGIVHESTSLSRPITGTLSSVNRINAKSLELFRKRTFTKDNIFFYVTGNYNDKDIKMLISEVDKYVLFEGQKHENIAPVSKNFANRSCNVHVKNSDFTMVRFTFDIDMKKVSVPETDLIYDKLLSGYSSEFFMEMSEHKGLFYDIGGALERYRNIGQLYFSYEVREKDLYTAVKMTVDILKKFKSQTLPDTELMKAGYVDNAPLLYDDAREFNFTMAYDNHIMQLGYSNIESRINAYSSVTPEDIRWAACQIFKRENLTLTLKGDKKKIDCSELEKIISEL